MFSRSAGALRTVLARKPAAPATINTPTRVLLSTTQQPTTSTTPEHPPSPLAAQPRTTITPTNQHKQQPPRPTRLPPTPPKPTFTTPLKVTRSLLTTLPHLTAQKTQYITAHLHARPYLLTPGDHVRLPFLMPNVNPGDVLRLNRASVLGSRDFTMKGTPYIDERLFECRVRVLGVDAEPMRVKEKTKRRNRHVKTVKSKHRFTLLRVMDVRVRGVEEVKGMGMEVVEDGEGAEKIEVN